MSMIGFSAPTGYLEAIPTEDLRPNALQSKSPKAFAVYDDNRRP